MSPSFVLLYSECQKPLLHRQASVDSAQDQHVIFAIQDPLQPFDAKQIHREEVEWTPMSCCGGQPETFGTKWATITFTALKLIQALYHHRF